MTSLVRRLGPLGLLAILTLAYFGELVAHPSRTLYSDHSDLIALHVPWETFLNRAWRQDGECPAWNPLQFAGLPFAHDIQAAPSYPPHAIFRWVGEAGVGPALSWLIVANVILAGWGMHAYARSTGLDGTSALVAAVGFMFAGKWLLHLTLAGHYAFAGLAWLPWIALGLDGAARGRGVLWAVWAGVALGLMALASHPQVTLYGGLFLAVWTPLTTYRRQIDASNSRKVFTFLIRCATLGVCVGLVAAGIASVGLLPSLEAVPLSTRGVSGISESPSVSLRSLLSAFGPSPEGVRPVVSWEPRSGFGVVWIAAAIVAPLLTTGADRRRARWALALLAALAVFAIGGAAIFRGLPLFKAFRHPSRMFLIASFPLAYLAAITTRALESPLLPETRLRARRIVAGTSVVFLAVLGIAAASAGRAAIRPHLYGLSLLVTVPASWWIVGKGLTTAPGRRVAWVAVLLVDLVAQTWPHVATRRLDEVLAPSAIALDLARRAGPLDRVLDRSLPGHQSTTPLGPAVSTNLGLQTVRGYNALDILRFKEFLAMIADPVVIPQPYNGLANLPIRHKALVDLLGVRFLVQPFASQFRPVDAPATGWRQVATDPAPRAFTFAVGGEQSLPPYELLENADAFPRAFVVPEVARLPTDRAAMVEAMTTTDFHRIALIESTTLPDLAPTPRGFCAAEVVSYRPNRIEVNAEGPGLLVLTDPWYPGWTAAVDGSPTPLYRTDHAFRGVALTPGRHAVTLTFRPRSLVIGRRITSLTWIVVAALSALVLARESLRWHLLAFFLTPGHDVVQRKDA